MLLQYCLAINVVTINVATCSLFVNNVGQRCLLFFILILIFFIFHFILHFFFHFIFIYIYNFTFVFILFYFIFIIIFLLLLLLLLSLFLLLLLLCIYFLFHFFFFVLFGNIHFPIECFTCMRVLFYRSRSDWHFVWNSLWTYEISWAWSTRVDHFTSIQRPTQWNANEDIRRSTSRQ